MRLDYTSFKIVKTIAANSGIPIKYLCEQLSIPRRNFYYRLDKINDWLTKNHINHIQNSRTKGLYLSPLECNAVLSLLDRIDTPSYELNSDERISQIFILLVISNRPIFVDDINKINKVSRNTTLSDIIYLNQKYHNVMIFKKKTGYYLNLNSLKQRLFVFQIIQSHLKYKTNFINQLILDEFHYTQVADIKYIEERIRAVVLSAEHHLKRQFTDKDRRLLRYMFMISLLHTLYHKTALAFSEQQQFYLTHQFEWPAAQSIQQDFLDNLNYLLPENEILIISLLLSVIKSHHFQEKYTRKDVRLIRCIRQLIAEFQRLSGIYFINKTGLEKQLFTHLKPAIQRGLFEIHIDNALREDIEQHYPQILNITKRAVVVIENEYQFRFNDDELSYIVMSFAAWLNKNEDTEEKHILLITEGGISSTAILEQQLRKLTVIPLSIHIKSMSEYLTHDFLDEVELIITTTELTEKDNNQIPIIKVKHILTVREQLQIRHFLENRDYMSQVPLLVNALMDEINCYIPNNQYINIQKRFDDIVRHNIALIGLPIHLSLSLVDSLTEHIQISRHKVDWPQAIDLVGKPLLDKSIIPPDYLQEIKENIKKFGMYMYLTPQVVLLHASPLDNLRRPFLSLLKLTKPISFMIGQQSAAASLIFLLVPEKSGCHIKLLEQLNNILSNESKLNKLLKATKIAQIKQILSEY